MGRKKLIQNFLSLVSKKKSKRKYARLESSSEVSLTDPTCNEVPRKESDERVTQNQGEFGKNYDEQTKHFNCFADYVHTLTGRKEKCDFEIHVRNVVFCVHGFVLARYCTKLGCYFSDLSVFRDPPIQASLNDFRPEVFRVFVEFCYNRKLNVNLEHIAEVIEMADILDIPVLKEQCLKRMCQEFSQVNRIRRFLELDVATFCEILSNDNLRISTEMDVFKVAWKWINHSMNERRQYLSRIMKTVRFPCMSQNELIDCAHLKDLVDECPEIRQRIQDANWVITVNECNRDDPWKIAVPTKRNRQWTVPSQDCSGLQN